MWGYGIQGPAGAFDTDLCMPDRPGARMRLVFEANIMENLNGETG
jgi:hypothetical protein